MKFYIAEYSKVTELIENKYQIFTMQIDFVKKVLEIDLPNNEIMGCYPIADKHIPSIETSLWPVKLKKEKYDYYFESRE